MKYLKKIFESDDITEKILLDFGLTEEEFIDIIDFIGEQEYSKVKELVPFIIDIKNDNYNISSYDNMRKLLNAYDYFKKKSDIIDEVEDYFLDITENPSSGITIQFSKSAGIIIIIAEFDSLSDISNKLNEIEKRLKRSNVEYKIESIRDTTNTETNKKVFYLRIFIKTYILSNF
jgi:hypothetical protein